MRSDKPGPCFQDDGVASGLKVSNIVSNVVTAGE